MSDETTGDAATRAGRTSARRRTPSWRGCWTATWPTSRRAGPVDPERLLAEHPAIADRLRACLGVLRLVEQVAGRSPEPAPSSDAWRGPRAGGSGDFRIIREVGRGGMGVVYEAEQVSLGRRVALKVLPFAAALDPRQLQRFQIEAQAAACLHHTNIVPVYAVGCERGVHYYAMQFIEGQTLADADPRAAPARRPGLRAAGRRPAAAIEPGPRPGSSSPPHGRRPAARATTSPIGPTVPRPATRPARRRPRRTAGLVAPAPRPATAPTSAPWPAWACRRPRRSTTPTHAGIIHRDIKPANLLLDAGATSGSPTSAWPGSRATPA